MKKYMPAGMAVAVITTVLVGPPAMAAGELRQVHGSIRTADGLPYANVAWLARAADGSMYDSGLTNADGAFTALAPLTGDTRLIVTGIPNGLVPGATESQFQASLGMSILCRHDDQHPELGSWSGTSVLVPADQARLDIVTPPTHNVTISVQDKYGEPVRNARVRPASMSTDTPNGGACLRPNQQFPLTGLEGVGAVGGWIPGRTGGLTGSNGQSLVSTPGLWDSVLDFAVVTAEIKPGAVQQVSVPGTALQGGDPLNRVAVAVLPYAPIMEDAATATEVPGAAATVLRVKATTTTPEVIVRQPSGEPLANTQVQIVPVLAGDAPTAPREGAVVATSTTGSEGMARFPGLSAGTYRAIPVNVSARTVDFSVAAPPPASPPAAHKVPVVKVKSIGGRSKLRVDVNPNRGSGYWTFRVEKLNADGRTWTTLHRTYKTLGSKETRTVNLKKGTYRVTVRANYGYARITSAPVFLRK